MNDSNLIRILQRCAYIAEEQRCINPVKMIRIECQLCKYAAQHNKTYLRAAMDMCAQDLEENICLIGTACLLTQMKN
jgi:hypothetical protein